MLRSKSESVSGLREKSCDRTEWSAVALLDVRALQDATHLLRYALKLGGRFALQPTHLLLDWRSCCLPTELLEIGPRKARGLLRQNVQVQPTV